MLRRQPALGPVSTRRPSVADQHRLRVLHVIDRIDRGGAENLMATILPEMQNQGVDAQMLVLKPVRDPAIHNVLERANVPVHFSIVGKLRRADQIAAAVRSIKALAPEVIHAHLQFATVIAAAAQWWLKVPSVATIHVLDRFESNKNLSVREHLTGLLLKRYLRRTIFLSNASLEAARRADAVGSNAMIVPNGVDIEAFRPDKDRIEIRNEFDIATDDKLLVSVAVLRRLKGLDVLIEAMPGVLQHCPATRLLVVGDGPELAALKRQATKLGILEMVTFAGFRTDISSILAAADVFVLPTRQDAFPTVILEAMASGLPVVASDVGGVPDMVGSTVGRLVQPDDRVALADTITEILTDDMLRSDMGHAARKKAEREFSLHGQVANLITLYRDLVKSPS